MPKSILEAGHDAIVKQVQTEHASKLQADITMSGVEASIDTTVEQWTFTAYVRKLWTGPWSVGGRITRSLPFLSSRK